MMMMNELGLGIEREKFWQRYVCELVFRSVRFRENIYFDVFIICSEMKRN